MKVEESKKYCADFQEKNWLIVGKWIIIRKINLTKFGEDLLSTRAAGLAYPSFEDALAVTNDVDSAWNKFEIELKNYIHQLEQIDDSTSAFELNVVVGILKEDIVKVSQYLADDNRIQVFFVSGEIMETKYLIVEGDLIEFIKDIEG